jgi:hypothetical protein
MKTTTTAMLALMVLVSGALASGPAMARHVRFGVYVGAPFYGPAYSPYRPYYPYQPPYYAYPPVVVAPAQPPVYIEQNSAPAPVASAESDGNWYYCADSNGYYPYVKECAAAWQRVPAQPPAR